MLSLTRPGLETPHVFPIKTLTPTNTSLPAGARLASLAFAALLPLGLNAATMVANNYNTAAVKNGPICQTALSLQADTVISGVATLHFNGGLGATGVTITLVETDGTPHGPYVAVPSGFDEVANVPNILLKAGQVTIVDSEPLTWSQNTGSCRCGFARLFGTSVGLATTTLFDNTNVGGVQNSAAGPPKPTTFTLNAQAEIDTIFTYMYPSNPLITQGPQAGTISLVAANGQNYGTYRAVSLPWPGVDNPGGAACVQNAEWFASPHILLPPGTYQIVPSATAWAFNSQAPTPGEGFAKLLGQ